MNENCKYCKTAKTCLENAEYNSIYCQIHKRIPKVIDKTYDELQQENQQLKKQLQKKEDIINKIEDYLIKNNLFSYKYDEEELYEIVTDDKARTDLLKILDNKGDENNGL